jgi:hypothetical protein
MIIDIPESLRIAVEREAKAKGVTPDEFVAAVVAEKIGVGESAAAYFAARASRAQPGAFERVFGAARAGGGEAPRAGDEQ